MGVALRNTPNIARLLLNPGWHYAAPLVCEAAKPASNCAMMYCAPFCNAYLDRPEAITATVTAGLKWGPHTELKAKVMHTRLQAMRGNPPWTPS